MPRNSISRLLLAAVLSLSLIGIVVAVPGLSLGEEAAGKPMPPAHAMGPREGGPPGGLIMMLRRLDLDDAQRESIRGLLEEAREQGEPLRADLKEKMRSLAELYKDEDADDEAIDEAIDAVIEAHEELRLHREGTKEEIRDVLTSRQQAKFLLMVARSAKRGPPHGRPPVRPGPFHR